MHLYFEHLGIRKRYKVEYQARFDSIVRLKIYSQ